MVFFGRCKEELVVCGGRVMRGQVCRTGCVVDSDDIRNDFGEIGGPLHISSALRKGRFCLKERRLAWARVLGAAKIAATW